MPFFRVDLDAYEELAAEVDPEFLPEKPPSGEFEYEPASGRFQPEELGPVSRLVLDALRAAGATRFRVRYDGGYDEGFANPEALIFGEEARSVDEAARDLGAGDLVPRLREAAGRKSMWGNAAELYQEASPEQSLRFAIDELAYDLASGLLGGGFGTGEYQLYGAFTADLVSGEIIDHPDAPKPDTIH